MLLVAACGGPPAPTTPAAPPSSAAANGDVAADPPASEATDNDEDDDVIVLEPLRIQVLRDDATGAQTVVAYDARALFDDGNAALVAGEHARALRLYDQLLADFPDSKLAVPALYNAGLALEGAEEFDRAIARYRELVRRQPTGRDSIDAHIRAAAVLAELERWRDAATTLDEVLARDDLTPSDRLEGRARRGYVLLEARDPTAAEATLAEAIRDYEAARDAGERFETDYFIAMARYYYAEIPRREFAAIPIRLPDEQIGRDVEAKAGLVLLASDRYAAAIEIGNVYWATASGYQLAAMQHEFWTAIVTAPVPPQLDAQAAEVYVEEVHQQVENLLEKALAIHRKNVKLAEVYDTHTHWSAASAERIPELAELLARERAGERVTPEVTERPPPSPRRAADYLPGRFEL